MKVEKIHAAKFVHISWCGEKLSDVKFASNWLDVTCSECFKAAPAFSAMKDKKLRKLLKKRTKKGLPK